MRGILHSDDFGWLAAPRFGGGSSVPSTTSSTSSSAPWSGQQGYLTGTSTVPGVFPAAASLYSNSSDWPQYYPGSTYAPLNEGQTQLIGALGNYAGNMGDSSLNAANSNITSMLSPSYTSGTQSTFNTANPEISNLSSGSLLGSTSQPFNQSSDYLSSMISGSTLNPFSSPGFQNVINGTLANVIPATSASFINGGRADSGLATAAQTAAATNAIGSLANQNYLQEQGLQSQAAQQAAQNEALGLNTTLGAGSLASNNLLTQQGNQLRGAAVAPGIDQSQLGDIETGLNAAGLAQQNSQDILNNAVANWNYNQTLPFNMLGQYQNYVGGTGYGGTTTGQSTTPYYSNTGSNLLSGALGGATLGSLLGSGLGLSGSTGALGGAGLGLLAAFSDRRLKTDIKKIGDTDNDLPLYMFRYTWDSPDVRRIGLMAQDVLEKKPEAVLHTPFGMAVDYAEALAA